MLFFTSGGCRCPALFKSDRFETSIEFSPISRIQVFFGAARVEGPGHWRLFRLPLWSRREPGLLCGEIYVVSKFLISRSANTFPDDISSSKPSGTKVTCCALRPLRL